MNVATTSLKETVIKILDELPAEHVAEVLDFALFLKGRAQTQSRLTERPEVQAIPAASLDSLVGAVNWGGDALADTERLYEVSTSPR